MGALTGGWVVGVGAATLAPGAAGTHWAGGPTSRAGRPVLGKGLAVGGWLADRWLRGVGETGVSTLCGVLTVLEGPV
jgi:hypothetical protein